jgi:superoxide oxidase
MSLRSSPSRFGSLAVLFHWLMLILIVAAYATMELKGLTPRRSPQRATLAAWRLAQIGAWCRV